MNRVNSAAAFWPAWTVTSFRSHSDVMVPSAGLRGSFTVCSSPTHGGGGIAGTMSSPSSVFWSSSFSSWKNGGGWTSTTYWSFSMWVHESGLASMYASRAASPPGISSSSGSSRFGMSSKSSSSSPTIGPPCRAAMAAEQSSSMAQPPSHSPSWVSLPFSGTSMHRSETISGVGPGTGLPRLSSTVQTVFGSSLPGSVGWVHASLATSVINTSSLWSVGVPLVLHRRTGTPPSPGS